MAKVNLIGVQEVDFDNEKGETIKGLKLHITYQDENVAGYKADSKFISAQACRNLGIEFDELEPLIGQLVDIETNIKGKVTGILPV